MIQNKQKLDTLKYMVKNLLTLKWKARTDRVIIATSYFLFSVFFFFLWTNVWSLILADGWYGLYVWLIAATAAFNIHKSCWRLRQAHHFCLKLIVTKQARHPGHQFRCLIGGSSGGRNRGKNKTFLFAFEMLCFVCPHVQVIKGTSGWSREPVNQVPHAPLQLTSARVSLLEASTDKNRSI